MLRSLAGRLPKISQRRLSCIPDDSEVARSLVERTTQCGAEQEALHATAATPSLKADVGPTTAITSRTPPLRADGAHILPDKGLSERQRAALVPEKPSTLSRAADARLPAERGHTDGRLREERIHECGLPDAQAHDSGGG